MRDATLGSAVRLGLCVGGLALVACSAPTPGGGEGPDAGLGDVPAPLPCTVQAPTSCPAPAPRFADVFPVFERRCAVCHGATASGPWPLDTYRHIADWEDTIRAHLLDCTMPPVDAGVPMTDEERTAILTWIRCGLPQ